MNRNLRLLLVFGTLALGLFVPGMIYGEDDPGIDLIKSVVVIESAPQTDRSLLEEEPITLEKLKQIEKPRNVCNIPCGDIWFPPTNCTQLCGEGASCFNGYCLLW
ncbi:MAG TPA: hypothetical protein VFR31_14315 [Thermoanaerobaculia bacterium]|nr:hypothetical protein [Thermoanaerobaculia bacterium]